jgi:hypothetical protein
MEPAAASETILGDIGATAEPRISRHEARVVPRGSQASIPIVVVDDGEVVAAASVDENVVPRARFAVAAGNRIVATGTTD